MKECDVMLREVYKALDEKLGRDITVIDIREVSTLADYFVITHGDNISQVQAMADNVQEKMHKAGYSAPALEGYREARWILMDYRDVVVNIFARDDRRWFDLERIWRDGKFLDDENMKKLLDEGLT